MEINLEIEIFYFSLNVEKKNYNVKLFKPILNLYQVWITLFKQRFCPFDHCFGL